jgi:alcohol dehydrogenase (NADP+)
MLNIHGRLITCGLPDDPFPGLNAMSMSSNGALFGGSHLGNKKECLAMLKLAAEKGIKPRIEVLPMSEAGKAVEGVKNNKVRYRYVLTQDLK